MGSYGDVCIIMAAYNGEKYIQEQVSSIFKSTYQNFVLHIYDDCSTDGTAELIHGFEAQYGKQVVYHQNRAGKGVVNNFLQAVEELDADYFMLCDQDDVWMEDKIEKTLHFIKGVEDAAKKMPVAVFCDAKVVDENLTVQAESFQRQSGYRLDQAELHYLLMENTLLGCAVMFNRALKKKLHRFPPQIRMHDWWIGLVASAFGTVGYLDEPLLLYRQHEKNVIGNTSKKNYIKNRVEHLEKQQEVLYLTCGQAEAFLEVYGEELSREQRELVEAFATLPEKNWLIRRYRIFKYRFYKSGWIRNIGVFLVV